VPRISAASVSAASADSETAKPRHHHLLTLRRARSARLEGWATPRLHPTLRDAPLRGAPQGEVMKRNMLWYQFFLQERCRLVDANRFTRRAQFPGCTPDPTDSRTLRRLARRDLPKESIRDFLRSVEGQQKQAMREGTQ
jgi:hypothetical protein